MQGLTNKSDEIIGLQIGYGTSGFRCRFCSRIFLTNQALGGHQKAHRNDPNWRKGTRHERVFIPWVGSQPPSASASRSRARPLLKLVRLSHPKKKQPEPNFFSRSVFGSVVSPWTPLLGEFHYPFAKKMRPNYYPFGFGQASPNSSPWSFAAKDKSQDSSSETITDEYVKDKNKEKGFEVNQPLMEEIDLELRL